MGTKTLEHPKLKLINPNIFIPGGHGLGITMGDHYSNKEFESDFSDSRRFAGNLLFSQYFVKDYVEVREIINYYNISEDSGIMQKHEILYAVDYLLCKQFHGEKGVFHVNSFLGDEICFYKGDGDGLSSIHLRWSLHEGRKIWQYYTCRNTIFTPWNHLLLPNKSFS